MWKCEANVKNEECGNVKMWKCENSEGQSSIISE